MTCSILVTCYIFLSLAAPEPTVEEKLQKLHSEIKFALKVDNPVSAQTH